MKNYIKLKERKDIVLIIENLTYIDTLELIQKINSTDNIIINFLENEFHREYLKYVIEYLKKKYKIK